MPNQKDTISYLSVGAVEEFKFTEVASFFGVAADQKPASIPEKIDVFIESFEVSSD